MMTILTSDFLLTEILQGRTAGGKGRKRPFAEITAQTAPRLRIVIVAAPAKIILQTQPWQHAGVRPIPIFQSLE
jgi:hypothetical protein